MEVALSLKLQSRKVWQDLFMHRSETRMGCEEHPLAEIRMCNGYADEHAVDFDDV